MRYIYFVFIVYFVFKLMYNKDNFFRFCIYCTTFALSAGTIVLIGSRKQSILFKTQASSVGL